MDQFVQFVVNHWVLCSAFVLLLVLILIVEMQAQVAGAKALSPQQAVSLMNHHKAQLIDIRHLDAFKAGHVIDAIHLTAQEIENKPKKLEKMKNNPIVIICSNGQQSSTLAAKLKQQGFEQAVVLKGGMAAWQNADLPTVAGK